MNLIGVNIIHTTYGQGSIIDNDENYIVVDFDNTRKKFVFPDVFGQFLSAVDNSVQKEIELLIADKAKQNELKLKALATPKKIQASADKRSIDKKRKVKLYPRENIAFKCNFCDGGADDSILGYHGVCTDKQINYNIEVAQHQWCANSNSLCCQYYNKQINRRYLDEQQSDGGFVCYESQMLREWRAYAGTTLRGKNASKPKKLHKVQPNSLTVLTTRLPYTSEKDRIIFAVFLIDEAYKGDSRNEGFVSTTSEYKIALTPMEAEQMKFWKYYKNKNSVSEAIWGTGLYRYFNDEISAQILRDIVKIKKGKSDKLAAKEFFEYYCKINGIDSDVLPAPAGALTYNHKA